MEPVPSPLEAAVALFEDWLGALDGEMVGVTVVMDVVTRPSASVERLREVMTEAWEVEEMLEREVESLVGDEEVLLGADEVETDLDEVEEGTEAVVDVAERDADADVVDTGGRS